MRKNQTWSALFLYLFTFLLGALFLYLSFQPPSAKAHDNSPPPPVWVWQNSGLQGNSLTRVSCLAVNNCWAVGQAGTILHYDGNAWSQAATAPGFKTLYDISCVSANFCVAVGADRLILKYDGVSWSPDAFGLATNDDIYAINCFSLTFCMAGGFGEYFYKYDGTNWLRLPPTTAPADTRPKAGNTPQHAAFENIYSLKCPTASSCFAAGEEHIWSYNGLTWSEVISEEIIFRDITCPTATRCFATSSNNGLGTAGAIWDYDGNTWQESLAIPAWLLGLTCTDSANCQAVGNAGSLYHYDGITWTLTAATNLTPTATTLNSVSCASAGVCWAVGQYGTILAKANAAWQVVVQPLSGPTFRDVACLSVINCYALDAAGNFYSYDGYNWSVVWSDVVSQSALACFPDFCYAVGGNSLRTIPTKNNNPSFGNVSNFPSYYNLADITCGSAVGCILVGKNISDGTGIIVGGGINPPSLDRGLTAVTCPAANSCWAVGESGLLVRFDGTTWQKQPDAPGQPDLTAISCVTVTECRAVGSDRSVVTYNGTSWNATNLPVALYPTALACPATGVCYVAGQTGRGTSVLKLEAGIWLTETVNNAYQLTALDCPNRLNCIAVGERGTILAKVASLTVTATNDTGDPHLEGTLSHALDSAAADYVINFRLPPNTSSVTISATLPPIPANVIINGGCGTRSPITLQGAAGSVGLRLAGNVWLHGLSINGFSGPQIIANGAGNKFSCLLLAR